MYKYVKLSLINRWDIPVYIYRNYTLIYENIYMYYTIHKYSNV